MGQPVVLVLDTEAAAAGGRGRPLRAGASGRLCFAPSLAHELAVVEI
jgi:hypothetical protein